MDISISYYSSIGTRHSNEDAVRITETKNGVLAAIADGLGGIEGGQLASEIALREFFSDFDFKHFSYKPMFNAIFRANLAVRKHQSENIAMCSTLSALWLKKNKAFVCYVGDSRIYQIRNGQIIYQSTDHSVPQLAVFMGEITPDEIRNHQDRNKLLRAVGADIDIKPQIESLRVKSGDAFLICTDGFWEKIVESDIRRLRGLNTDAEKWLLEMREHIADLVDDNNSAIAIIVN